MINQANHSHFDSWESFLYDFDKSWSESRMTESLRFLSSMETGLRTHLLLEMAKIDLDRRWESDQRLPVEDYLKKHHELSSCPDASRQLIRCEIELRLETDDPFLQQEFAERFPDFVSDWDQLHRSAVSDSLSGVPRNALNPKSIFKTLPCEFGRYKIKQLLGRGTMGEVYRATDKELERDVALKFPYFSEVDKGKRIERFHREALAAAKLHHPNICPIYDVGQHEDKNFIAMAYVKGRRLDEIIRVGTVSTDKAVTIICKLASALDSAHKSGIVHGDIKPANIIIDERGEPILTDFSLARPFDQTETAILAASGLFDGTPSYMAPEQVRGEREKIGKASDVYSLGVLFYELLTGSPAYTGQLTEVLLQISSQEPFPNPAEKTADLDPKLAAICRKMTAKEVKNRYRSMQVVVESLSGHFQQKSSVSLFHRKSKWIASVAILVCLVASFFLFQSFFFLPVVDSKPEFVSIFNGTDLTGWEYDQGLWWVEDGAIVGIGNTHVSFVHSKKRYRNFILKLKFQLVKGNSGVFFRGDSVDGRHLVGYQADITDEPSRSTGSLYAHGLHGWIDGPDLKQKQNILKSIETEKWHDYEITAIGNRIEIKLDGNTTALGRDSSFTEGVIGFQLCTIETLVKIKDVQIKELPESAEENDSVAGSHTSKVKLNNELDEAIHITKYPFNSETARRFQERCATSLGIPVEFENTMGMRFRLIPPGKYSMGSGKKVKGHDYLSPPHWVVLTRPFYIGIHEVTQKEYVEVMGVNPSLAKADEFRVVGDQFPVCNVSWNEISEFCKRLTKKESLGIYRLPTEAEWEYACRAGSDQDYCFGNDVSLLNGFAWYQVNSDCSPHNVDLKSPNSFGVRGMHGNVFEFCSDGFMPNYYKLSPVFNPQGPSSPTILKVFRGGSWKSKPQMCRSATRVAGGPDAGIEHGGFRVVLEIPN